MLKAEFTLQMGPRGRENEPFHLKVKRFLENSINSGLLRKESNATPVLIQMGNPNIKIILL